MSLWQFMAAYNGYVQANGSGNRLSESQKDELFDWLSSDGAGPRWLETQTYWWDASRPVPKGRVQFRA